MIKFSLAATYLFIFACAAQAEVVYLKNGKTVEGRIVEQTDKYIKIDFLGTPLLYWSEEIDKIEAGEEAALASVKGESAYGKYKKATDYLQEGKWRWAAAVLKSVVQDNPELAGAHFNLGCAYALMGDYSKAVEEFERARSLEERFMEEKSFKAFCYFNIAGVYFKQAILAHDPGLFVKASENFLQAVTILPNFVLASDYANQAEIFSRIKNQGKAKFGLGAPEIGLPPDSAIFLKPGHITGANEQKSFIFDESSVPPLFFFRSPLSRWRVCEAKLDITKPNEISQDAKQCFQGLLDLLDKKSFNRLDNLIRWNVYFIFAKFFAQQGDLDRAIEFAVKAKDIGLNYSIEYKNLASLYLEKGNFRQAKTYAEKALEINPQIPGRNILEDIIKKANLNTTGR